MAENTTGNVTPFRFDCEDVIAVAASLAADDSHIWTQMVTVQQDRYIERATRAMMALMGSRRERGA